MCTVCPLPHSGVVRIAPPTLLLDIVRPLTRACPTNLPCRSHLYFAVGLGSVLSPVGRFIARRWWCTCEGPTPPSSTASMVEGRNPTVHLVWCDIVRLSMVHASSNFSESIDMFSFPQGRTANGTPTKLRSLRANRGPYERRDDATRLRRDASGRQESSSGWKREDT